jgi:hypothetical protein
MAAIEGLLQILFSPKFAMGVALQIIAAFCQSEAAGDARVTRCYFGKLNIVSQSIVYGARCMVQVSG